MTAPAVTSAAIDIVALADPYVSDVLALMRATPEVSFCDWEDLRAHANSAHAASFVAVADGEVVAAVIGGSLGVRGTISHLAVKEGHRRAGIGGMLVRHALTCLQHRGVRRMFVVAHDVNVGAQRFWEGIGFVATLGETTFELDV